MLRGVKRFDVTGEEEIKEVIEEKSKQPIVIPEAPKIDKVTSEYDDGSVLLTKEQIGFIKMKKEAILDYIVEANKRFEIERDECIKEINDMCNHTITKISDIYADRIKVINELEKLVRGWH